MDHFPSRWGKPRNENVDAYNTVPLHKSLPDSLSQSAYGPVSHTQWVQLTPIASSTTYIQHRDNYSTKLTLVYRWLSSVLSFISTPLQQLTFLFFHRQPLVTGTSVIAFKYRDGVMMAADMLGTLKNSLVWRRNINTWMIRLLWFTCSIPWHWTIISCWWLHHCRLLRRYFRLPIYPASFGYAHVCVMKRNEDSKWRIFTLL